MHIIHNIYLFQKNTIDNYIFIQMKLNKIIKNKNMTIYKLYFHYKN